MRIAVIGTGYVGLVTGACLAARGHRVTCVDQQQEIVRQIQAAQAPIFEPGLEEILREVTARGRLSATTNLKEAVLGAELSLVAVGTPLRDGEIDLSQVREAVAAIGRALKETNRHHTVCIKSTVVPTTTDTLVKQLLTEASGRQPGEFGLAMNPEFLREGRAVEDFLKPDRIVIGADDDFSFAAVQRLYEGRFDAPLLRVSLRTAEMIKYAANSLLANLISYSNEVASICEATGGVDVREVLDAVTRDKRFHAGSETGGAGPEITKYLEAGCGFGGSCFPKDVQALAAYSRKRGYQPRLLQATLAVNREQPLRLVARLAEELGGLAGRRVAVLGLAFKPGTDDVRGSPSIAMIRRLLEKGAEVRGADPRAAGNMNDVIPAVPGRVRYFREYAAALDGADAVILATSWPEYLEIPPDEFRRRLKRPLVVDGRRALNREGLEGAGCRYLGVGLKEKEKGPQA
jgi:UDPglucose 6-dehydrogenase